MCGSYKYDTQQMNRRVLNHIKKPNTKKGVAVVS